VLRKDGDGRNYDSDEVVEVAEYVANGAMETYRIKMIECGVFVHRAHMPVISDIIGEKPPSL